MPKSALFGSQMRLFGTQRNPLYKCNHLGGVLEAQDRKSAVFIKKSWIPPQQLKYHQNMFFAVKSKISAKMQGNHKICYNLCFKHMSRLQAPLVLGPEDHKIKEMCEFSEIDWIFVENGGNHGNLQISHIFAEKCDSGGNG